MKQYDGVKGGTLVFTVSMTGMFVCLILLMVGI